MATIFEKVPASGEKCLVLDSKESLVYPFNVGEWEEIRIGAALSFTSSSGLNDEVKSEIIYNIYKNNYFDHFYFGIKSNNHIYPRKESCSFIGVGPTYGDIDSLSYSNLSLLSSFEGTQIQYGDGLAHFIIPSGANQEYYYANYYANPVFLPTASQQTGLNNFFGVYGLKIKIKNRGTNNQQFSISSFNNGYNWINYPSALNIRQVMLNPTNSTSEFTGYFTSTYESGGNPAPIPDAFYISNPFISGRIRIHQIVIEKYA